MRQLLSRMDSHTLVLDLAQPLAALPRLSGFAASLVDEHTLEVEVSRGANITALFSELSLHNIVVSSLRNKTNRLEELFTRSAARTRMNGRARFAFRAIMVKVLRFARIWIQRSCRR
jgi:ABC-2 type transport system ATP-binding protein